MQHNHKNKYLWKKNPPSQKKKKQKQKWKDPCIFFSAQVWENLGFFFIGWSFFRSHNPHKFKPHHFFCEKKI
jgi:hypothetical protein